MRGKGTWKKRYDHEFLYKLLNEPNITKYINRLSQAEHVMHMENRRTVKKVFDTGSEGTRETGGPKWCDPGYEAGPSERCGYECRRLAGRHRTVGPVMMLIVSEKILCFAL